MELIAGATLRSWALVAVSLFNTILLLWLGLSLWLHADRRDPGVVLSTGGFLLGGLFFISHSALLLSRTWEFTRSNTLWLATAMIPVLLLPYVWYVVLLRNAGFWDPGESLIRPRHRPGLLVTTVALVIGFGCLVLLGIPFIPALNSLTPFIWPLRQFIKVPVLGIPLVAIAYPLYVVLCVVLSIDTLHDLSEQGRSSHELHQGDASNAGKNTGRTRISFRRSRTHLFAATLVLLLIGILVAIAVVWTISNTRESGYYVLRPDDINTIAVFDLVIALLIALVAFLLGQAMTRYELFMGKDLPRRELARHWKRAIALAAGYGVLLGGALVWGLEPVYAVLLTAVLMTAFFVLLGWRASVEWRQAMRQLRPMVTSEGWYGQLTANAAHSEDRGPATQATAPLRGSSENGTRDTGSFDCGSQTAVALRPGGSGPPDPVRWPRGYDNSTQETGGAFDALCRDVLAAPLAYLVPAGPLSSFVEPLTYPHGTAMPSTIWMPQPGASPEQLASMIPPEEYSGAAWGIPLWGEHGLAGVLLLGSRRDGSLYSEEDLEIGRAAGERLIDAAASLSLSQRLMQLQREQMTAAQLLDQRTRRVLHDEVLPLIHTAMLSLPADAAGQTASMRLSEAHGQISALLRDLPMATTPDVTRLGAFAALRKAIADEFGPAFESVTWACDEAAERAAKQLPAIKAETLYYAARELVRNAARHAQPSAGGLHLAINATYKAGQLVVAVEDNGEDAGISAAPGHGLALHTALMAIAGGSLTVQTLPGKGARGEILLRNL